MGSSATSSALIFSMRFSICFMRFSVIGIAYTCYTLNATTIERNCHVMDPLAGSDLVPAERLDPFVIIYSQPIDGGRMVVSAILKRFRSEEHTSELQSRQYLV